MHECIKTDIFFSNNKNKSVYIAFQSNDQKKAIWRGGQPAARSGQCPWAFPQVHGHTPDQTTLWKVTEIHTHTQDSHFPSFSCKQHECKSSSHSLQCLMLVYSWNVQFICWTAENWLHLCASVVSYYSLFMEINTVPNIRTRRATEQSPNTPAFLPWRKK